MAWSFLEGGDPSSKECLEKHLAKLEKAHKKAMKNQTKKSLEQESLEKDEDVEMEKVEVEDSLEKGVPKNGKNGPRKDSLVSAQNLEKERQLKEQLKKALEKASTEEAAAGGTSSSSSRPAGPMQSMPLIGQLEQALERPRMWVTCSHGEIFAQISQKW